MPRTYQPKLLPDGSTNPKYKLRPYAPRAKRRAIPQKYDPLKPRKKYVNAYKSKFANADFYTVDGEGGDWDGVHVYQYLAGLGGSIYKESGLSSIECFDFLLEQYDKNRRSIFVIFAGSYDANMWLSDLPKTKIQEIVDAEGKCYTKWRDYLIRYIPRKLFALKRASDPANKGALCVWDAHGFFQGSFVNAIKNWLPGDARLDLITRGKQLRTNFTGSDREFMETYNKAELDILNEIMIKFRAGLLDMGISISRWDGAGAVAMGMYKLHNVKQYYAELPAHVQTAAAHAYFGGRIEIGKVGRANQPIYHYDINSAYPSVQKDLPALAGGVWDYSARGDMLEKMVLERRAPRMSVYLVRWHNITGTPFCPFPYRSEAQQKVLFPSAGLNWIWLPELEAAFKWRENGYAHWSIEILEAHLFNPATDTKPFHWIDQMYTHRLELVEQSKRSGIPNGAEKNIKLGLNSLYGKTAQRVGYNENTGAKPPYHNLAYAGYITSTTRAKLWDAAMQHPFSVVALATDGLYSLQEHVLDCPARKTLGAWERSTHDEMVLVQAGFYFLRNGDTWASFSRGFDKMVTQADMTETRETILSAWKKRGSEVHLPCTRFITLKSALRGENWWPRWRTWYKSVTPEGVPGRRLKILPHGTKREIVGSGAGAHNKMIQTMPTLNHTPDILSSAHSLPWDTDIDCNDDIDSGTINDEHDIDSD